MSPRLSGCHSAVADPPLRAYFVVFIDFRKSRFPFDSVGFLIATRRVWGPIGFRRQWRSLSTLISGTRTPEVLIVFFFLVSFGSSFNEAVSEIVRVRGSGVPVADLCWSFTSLAQLLPLCFRGVLYLHRSALPTYMGNALPTTHI